VAGRGTKALIVGVDSVIGSSLAAHLRSGGVSVVATSRRATRLPGTMELDLLSGLDSWTAPTVDCVFLCAAATSIHACEQDPGATRLVNVEGPVRLAQRLIERGARVVFLSSNLVFDGSRPFRRVDEPTCPTTVYGHHKAQAEEQLLAMGARVSVLRLTKVLGTSHPLLGEWARALAAGQAIHPFRDVLLAPVALRQSVEALSAIARHDADGVFHLSGDRDVTYAHLAGMLATEWQANPTLVQPMAGRAVSTPPAQTTLDTSSLARLNLVAWPTDRTIQTLAADVRHDRAKAA
jgi:dTDP-4-dehydrorhamnose reductase